MKPANLLLNSECLMKVADFGLARSLLKSRPKNGADAASSSADVGAEDMDCHDVDTLTDYVATRWYRAPEILVASTKYGVEVDLWSLGTAAAAAALAAVRRHPCCDSCRCCVSCLPRSAPPACAFFTRVALIDCCCGLPSAVLAHVRRLHLCRDDRQEALLQRREHAKPD